MKILLVTRSYPSANDLYQYPFVHRRVLAYGSAGHDVTVFKPAEGPTEQHDYDGVRWLSGSAAALRALVERSSPDCIAVHGLSESVWPALSPFAGQYPIRAWLHGSEIPSFARRKAEAIDDPDRRSAALRQADARVLFWRDLISRAVPKLQLVFVSHASVAMMREDLGDLVEGLRIHVIPNPIDTELFSYEPKSPDQRSAILSIRPYDSVTYANDLAVRAVLHLSTRADFHRFSVKFIGNGPLFEETLQPLRHLSNVAIERRFLTQSEIAAEHRQHGVFLVPTRLDTQGVSRDEAMASGLVPVTHALSAVTEFVDPRCAYLAPPEDWKSLADALASLADRPEEFVRMSAAAAARVRGQTASAKIIPRELACLVQAAED